MLDRKNDSLNIFACFDGVSRKRVGECKVAKKKQRLSCPLGY